MQAGRHRLTFFNRPLDHNAVNRRSNLGALQIHAGLRERGLALRHIGLRRFHLRIRHGQLSLRRFQALASRVDQGFRAIRFALRNELLVHQVFLAIKVALRLLHIHLRTRDRRLRSQRVGLRREHLRPRRIHIGLRLPHTEFKRLRVNLRNQLARCNFRVEIHIQLFDLPAHLRAHAHLRDWIDRATGRHAGLQIAAL